MCQVVFSVNAVEGMTDFFVQLAKPNGEFLFGIESLHNTQSAEGFFNLRKQLTRLLLTNG